MFPNIQRNSLSFIFLITVCANQGCSEVVSTTPMPVASSTAGTIPSLATNTAMPTKTPMPEPVSTVTTSPVPPGVYVLFFYPPLVIKYDPLVWDDELHARELSSCLIGEQGPTDFNGPHTSEIVRLGKVEYEIMSFPEEEGRTGKAYIAEQSFGTKAGLPVFWVISSEEEWEECKSLAETVLATLYFP